MNLEERLKKCEHYSNVLEKRVRGEKDEHNKKRVEQGA